MTLFGSENNPVRVLCGNDFRLFRPMVMVTAIGDDFMPGCKEAMNATCEDLKDAGYGVINRIIFNICAKPYSGIGAMRNTAVAEALEMGADFLVLLENDVLLEDPTTVRRLLFHGHIVTPMLEQVYAGEKAYVLAMPTYEPKQGFLPLQWTVMSLLVIDTLVFQVMGVQPFSDLLINNEDEYVCHGFHAKKVRIWQDTDSKVKLLRPPACIYDILGVPRPPNWKPDIWPNPFNTKGITEKEEATKNGCNNQESQRAPLRRLNDTLSTGRDPHTAMAGAT